MNPKSPQSHAFAPLPRRRFQFSIRSLLALTFLTAAVFAFWVRPALQQREALEALRGHYTDVFYDVPDDPQTGQACPRWVPRWVVTRLGIDFVANVTGLEVYNATDDVLRKLKKLPRLQSLLIHGTDFTSEDGLAQVGQLSQLQVLAMPRIRSSNAGLEQLGRLERLSVLELSDARVTDEGLRALKGCSNLRQLYLSGTSVTDDGIAELKTAIPGCMVTREGHATIP
jgi:hypothetical protein